MRCVVPLIAVALAGCKTVPASGAGPSAGLGGIAEVGEVTVRPLRLVKDSRCPIEVTCVWQARLRIEAQVDAVGGSEEYRLILTLGEAAALGGGVLTMVDAQPAKRDGPIDSRAYRFTFAFSPGR